MEEVNTEGHYDVDESGSYYCIDTPKRRFLPQLCTNLSNQRNSPQGWKIIKNDRRLTVPRHTYYEYTLYAADYVESYFPKSYQDGKHIIGFGNNTTGFWLIRADEADSVYAILKSDMFKAWCELTEYSGGDGHFAQGMWGTFPIQNTGQQLSKLKPYSNSQDYLDQVKDLFGSQATVEDAIACAGKWLKNNNWPQHSLSFNTCMDVLCGFGPVSISGYSRKQILAEGFLDAFYGVEAAIINRSDPIITAK